jgi:hypothetical protein
MGPRQREAPQTFYIVMLFDEELWPEFERKTDEEMLNELDEVLEDIRRDLARRKGGGKQPPVYWLLVSKE